MERMKDILLGKKPLMKPAFGRLDSHHRSVRRSGRDVPATGNDLSKQRKQQSGLEGKEIIRIKQDGETSLQLLLASKSAQPEQHLLFYIYMALMVSFLSAT